MRRPQVEWDEQRKADLRRLTLVEGLGPSRAAKAMDLTRAQVTGARQRYRILSGVRKGVRKSWTDADLRAVSEALPAVIRRVDVVPYAVKLEKSVDAVRMAVQRWRREQKASVS